MLVKLLILMMDLIVIINRLNQQYFQVFIKKTIYNYH